MRPVLVALLVLPALAAVALPAAADHEIPICVSKPRPHGSEETCIGTAEGPHVPSVPPICFWQGPPPHGQYVCLS